MTDSPPRTALFAGLIQDEDGNPVEVVMVGGAPNYVVEELGFRRHIETEMVDRQVIEMLREQLPLRLCCRCWARTIYSPRP